MKKQKAGIKTNPVGAAGIVAALFIATVCIACVAYVAHSLSEAPGPPILPTQETGMAQGLEQSTDSMESPEDSSPVLKGYVICIDPGHASSQMSGKEKVSPLSSETKLKCTSGTSGVSQTEAELNLSVGLKLATALEELGVKVVMTREDQNTLISNIQRAEIANSAEADLCIRIHADGSQDPAVKGISMLVPSGKLLGTSEIQEPSAKAGEMILNAVIEATGANNRGIVKRSDLTGFNWSQVPCVLIEMGFLTNREEDTLLATAEYQDKLCRGMVEGIKSWLLDSKK